MRPVTLFNCLVIAMLLLTACGGVPASPSQTAVPPTPTAPRAATATPTLRPPTATRAPSATTVATTVPITACAGAPPIVHQVGQTIMVSTDNNIPNRVRAEPSRAAKLLGELAPGEQAKIIGGPVCADAYTWWQVKAAKGLTGWTIEGDQTGYWLVATATGGSGGSGGNTAARAAFAAYQLEPVLGQPAVQADPIDPGMGNVLVPLALSPEQLARLGESGVVASPRPYREFDDLYQETRWANLPMFITSDSLLHSYHLLFDKALRTLEAEVFLPKLQTLNADLLAATQAQYKQLKGSTWEEAALRTVAYVAVASQLADEKVILPAEAAQLAEAELALINAAAGPAASPIFSYLINGEDYSQYVPRSHYTRSEALKAYFKTMMWYGRMTFRVDDPGQPEAGPAETRMAVLLTLAVYSQKNLPELWADLYDPTAFLVGRSDDLTLADYRAAMDTVYGPQADLKTIATDAQLPAFIAAVAQLPAPRILGLISEDYKPLGAVKGLRFMGQRFVPDAYVFQELIHPKVPNRFLPSGLDVMAALGSPRAQAWLQQQDPNAQTPAYAAQFQKMTTWLGGLAQAEWTETAYNGWLYALRPLLETPGAGYPQFMQSTAWHDKQLNAALGSWAELKHDTLLYAKQPYGGLGGGGDCPYPPGPVRAQNYVEPVPAVFARIAALATMTGTGLQQRGLTQTADGNLASEFDWLARIALQLKGMAEKELAGQPLSPEEKRSLDLDFDYLSFLGHVVDWANDHAEEPEPAAIIADVATDPNSGQVLEVGVGAVDEIYVVAPILQSDGHSALTVARGGVFSYYEFPSPQRLTDEAWRAQLAQNPPARPNFAGSFSVPQAASLDIQQALYRFQLDWVDWVYYTGAPCGPKKFSGAVSDSVLQQANATIAALRDRKQYEGRQWVSTDYLSVERPSASQASVTVRETWKDFLVQYTGADPFAWYFNKTSTSDPVTARRGPYTVDVRYTLEYVEAEADQHWRITGFEELTPRPEWGTP